MITISWSDILGTLVDDLTKVGFVTNRRSKRFFSLVGRLCICVKLNASVMSTKPFCISLSGPVAVRMSHLMSGKLKSPASIILAFLWLLIFDFVNDFYRSSRCFCFLCGM